MEKLICTECGQVFETDGNELLCEDCEEVETDYDDSEYEE